VKTNKEVIHYKCDWPNCGHEFDKAVGVGYAGGRVSSQVICPRCGNFLKTW
jgi:hypothetical protein